MKILSKIALIISVLFVIGCSSKTDIESDLGIAGAPDWVNEGTKVVNNDDGRLIHGIGSAPQMGDASLQKSTADNRARAELARIMSSFIDATMDDFSSSNGEAFDMSVERAIKSSTQVALNGSTIVGNWKDKETGTIYSFAELDLAKLQDAIANAEQLNNAFQKYFDQSFDANFDRFMKEQK